VSQVLFDTDVLIDHIRGHRQLRAGDVAGSCISVVTRAELFAGREDGEPTVEALLERFSEIDLTPDIATRAGRIRRDTGLDIADALIAATAIAHQIPLMTRNRRHFERISELRLHDAPQPAPNAGDQTAAGGT
jgi:predicted nucleic acid-binding protein